MRRDRNRNGGGVAILIRNTIPFTQRTDLESSNLETIWIEIHPSHRSRLLINALYRPPSSDLTTFFNEFTCMIDLASQCGLEIACLGDFNINMDIKNADSNKLSFITGLYQLH